MAKAKDEDVWIGRHTDMLSDTSTNKENPECHDFSAFWADYHLKVESLNAGLRPRLAEIQHNQCPSVQALIDEAEKVDEPKTIFGVPIYERDFLPKGMAALVFTNKDVAVVREDGKVAIIKNQFSFSFKQ